MRKHRRIVTNIILLLILFSLSMVFVSVTILSEATDDGLMYIKRENSLRLNLNTKYPPFIHAAVAPPVAKKGMIDPDDPDDKRRNELVQDQILKNTTDQEEDPQVQNNDERFNAQDINVKNNEVRIEYQDTKVNDNDGRMKDQDAKVNDNEVRMKDQDAKVNDNDGGITDQDANVNDNDRRITDQDTNVNDGGSMKKNGGMQGPPTPIDRLAKRQGQNLSIQSIKETYLTPASVQHINSDSSRRYAANNPAGGPGEGGEPVVIDKALLSTEELKKYEQGWQDNAYNLYASDMISLHRELKDNRDTACKTMKYRPLDELPRSSVIIIFHNEGWSVLLRTVHSVIDRSPPQLLHEVILVDDASTMDHLHAPLDNYIATLAKVQLVRAPQREGLIRARLLGAEKASGEILVFLDSHCEAATGWLEPLADRIRDSWSNVVTPVIEVINDDTFRYQSYKGSASTSVGGFTWSLMFTWHDSTSEDRAYQTSPVGPIRSPTMAGGLFAINRKYFYHIGTYDPGMEIWGGENLEMSFRIWMCGGNLEIVPCSQVGHIFRSRSPYSVGKAVNFLYKNNKRLAEVWMDDYKKYYYMMAPDVEAINGGDVSERKKLRERLQCKDFGWYLKTIYPSLHVPSDSLAIGEIRSHVGRRFCLDGNARNKPVITFPCHQLGGNQLWMLTNKGEIMIAENCLFAVRDSTEVKKSPCSKYHTWEYTEHDQLRSHVTRTCLAMTLDKKSVAMETCSLNQPRQLWHWHRLKSGEKVEDIWKVTPRLKAPYDYY